jgi:hypothetical protein
MPTEQKLNDPPEEIPADGESQDQSQDEGKRERSTIQFPYQDLSEAVAIAKGVHTAGGASCQVDQLAGELKQSPTSSMFKLRVSTARIFGLVTNAQGNVSLTALGTRVCDPQQEQAAKAEAFLSVPLYKQVYDQFKGASLPPANGLETTMVTMGVAPKQKSNARQVFHRSATQAGFFAYGNTRLVYPVIKAGSSANGSEQIAGNGEATVEKARNAGTGHDGGGGDGGRGGIDCDPAIMGLIRRLPQPDTDWPLEKQARWLLAVSHAFAVVYPREDDGKSLNIEIVKD